MPRLWILSAMLVAGLVSPLSACEDEQCVIDSGLFVTMADEPVRPEETLSVRYSGRLDEVGFSCERTFAWDSAGAEAVVEEHCEGPAMWMRGHQLHLGFQPNQLEISKYTEASEVPVYTEVLHPPQSEDCGSDPPELALP